MRHVVYLLKLSLRTYFEVSACVNYIEKCKNILSSIVDVIMNEDSETTLVQS